MSSEEGVHGVSGRRGDGVGVMLAKSLRSPRGMRPFLNFLGAGPSTKRKAEVSWKMVNSVWERPRLVFLDEERAELWARGTLM